MPPNMQEELEQPLEKFGTDITALAREHKLDPVIGRDEEIAALCKFSADVPKTTPFSSASRVLVKPPSSRL